MTMPSEESIRAIRSVRLASHQLFNACNAAVGGTQMALSLATVNAVKPTPKGWRERFAELWK